MLDDDVGYSPVLRTSYDVPAFGSFPEWWKVYRRAMKWFAKNVHPLLPKKPYDPICHEWFIPRAEADDRTLYIDNCDAAFLSSRLLKRLQRTFLARYPYWRVLFIGEDAATAVIVYPDAIRVGNEPENADIDEALKRLVPVLQALVDQRQRPMFEQIEFIKQHLADAIQSVEGKRFHLMGVIDVGSYDFDEFTICILAHAVSYYDNITVNLPAQSPFTLSTTGPLNVDAIGTIVSDDEKLATAPFVVLRWFLPQTYSGAVTIADLETGQLEAIEMTPDAVIKWHETFAKPANSNHGRETN